MKLLMITQKIDADDDILGVYHEWARHIAQSFDKFAVVCLYQGRTDLPENIQVFSLGKERGREKIARAVNLYKFIWSLRKDYGAVFVHMNPIYVLLGFIPWRLMRKKIFLWYAHPAKNMLVRIAYLLCDKVITSVPEAFFAQSKKVIAIGQGIDINKFKIQNSKFKMTERILSLGRISPAKRIDILLATMKILRDNGLRISASVVGDPSETYGGGEYLKSLQKFCAENNLQDRVFFESSVPNRATPEVYNRHSVFVNFSPNGYFDKTVLEAMASGCIPLVSGANHAYRHVFPKEFHEFLVFRQDDAGDLAKKIINVLRLSSNEREVISKILRQIIEQNHSIFTLGKRLHSAMANL